MREVQDIKRLIYPLVKQFPWILLILIGSILLTRKLTVYQNPVYESKSIIRLDNHSQGFSDNNLYKDLDIFSQTNDVLEEVEILKSEVILLKALDLMPTNIEYFREGELKTSEIYVNPPFIVEIDSNHFGNYDELIEVKVRNKEGFLLVIGNDSIHKEFDQNISFKENTFKVRLNPSWLVDHTHDDLIGDFYFRVNTKEFLISNFVGENLFVKEVDKNVGIITVHFEGEDPQRVSDFTNAVTNAYITDHTNSKMQAADLTENFLNKRLDETRNLLIEAEKTLENFRLKNNVLNIKQETETNLRKFSQLDIQELNLNMKMVVLDSLVQYIRVDRVHFLSLAPSYEAYGGLLFTELIKKLKSLEGNRIDALNKFTEDSEEIKTIDNKIEDVVNYIVENIENHRKSTASQLEKLRVNLEKEKRKLDDLPTLEKNILGLERNFGHYQDLFNFLKKKKLEAGVAKMAGLNFHRIIKKATPAKDSTRPNATFNIALAGFVSLLFSVALVYILELIRGKFSSRYQLEKMSEAPVIGVVKRDAKENKDGSLSFILSTLIPKIKAKEGVKVSINSSLSKEGKTYLAHYCAETLAKAGWKVLLIDLNLKKNQWRELSAGTSDKNLESIFVEDTVPSTIVNETEMPNLFVCGYSIGVGENQFHHYKNFEEKMNLLTAGYDVVLFDCPAHSISSETSAFNDFSDYKIFVVRHDFTDTKFIKNINFFVDNYGIENVGLVLNNSPKGVNYSGNYYGSRFHYEQPKGIKAKVKHYWESYRNAWDI